MFKIFHIGFICLVLIGLAGCVNETKNTSTSYITETQPSMPLPSTTIFPTSTSSPTGTISVVELVVKKCIQQASIEIPPPVESTNQFLLLRNDQPPHVPFIVNLATGIKTPVSDSDIIIWTYVSPNQRRFANGTANKISIAGIDGEISHSIPIEDWTYFWGWLDNDHLMFTPKASEGERLPPLIVLGLSDGSRAKLKSDYPDLDDTNYLPWQFNRVIYDPTLTFAVYPSAFGWAITLFDISNDTILSTLPAITTQTQQPKWSPDGKYVAVAGTIAEKRVFGNIENYDQELFLLDKSGNIIRLTHLTDQYHEEVWIGTLSWSPDGKHIAFWFSIGDRTEKRLAVFDLEAKTVLDYCVIHNASGYPPAPVWSPDSKIILVNIQETRESRNKIVWVNTRSGEWGIMTTNATVEGWLITP